MMHVLCVNRLQALRALDMMGVMQAGGLSIHVYTTPEALRSADLAGRVVLSIAGLEGFPRDLEDAAWERGASYVSRQVRAPVFQAQFQGGTDQREGDG